MAARYHKELYDERWFINLMKTPTFKASIEAAVSRTGIHASLCLFTVRTDGEALAYGWNEDLDGPFTCYLCFDRVQECFHVVSSVTKYRTEPYGNYHTYLDACTEDRMI